MNARRALAGLLAILPLAALLLVTTLMPVPERVPTHWSGRLPDGWTEGGTFAATTFTIVAVAALAAAAAGLLQRAIPQAWSRWLIATAATVGWAAVAVHVLTVWRTRLDGPDRVGDGWALLALLAGLVAGALVYVVHGRRTPTRQELADLVPERSRVQPARRPGGRVEPWSTTVRSRTMQVMGWVLLVVMLGSAGVVAATGGGIWLTLVLALTGVLVAGLALAWSAVRISVDADGLTVRSEVLPLRVSRTPAEDVAGVDVQLLDPMRWGGIGLRALPDRTAFIVDSGGPGIVVYKRDGRRLALQITEGDAVARDGARTLLQAAGQRAGRASS